MARAVITFHSIDDSGSVLSFPTRAFTQLIERFAVSGTPVVTFEELLRRDDGVTITFDDGMRSVYDQALPVLRAHGFPAHIFLTTSRVGQDIGWSTQTQRFDMLNWNQVGQCAQSGLHVECHTVTHADLRNLPPQLIVEECTAADDAIERHTGRRPKLMAFPFGRFSQPVLDTVGSRYTACFTTELGYLRGTDDLRRVPRLDSYYLQAPFWNERLFSLRTRSYVALRAALRAARGRA
ncbi:MAG: polysaccharide deacetylase family protein [Burkholderiaceae bacterium]|nr:polysaccharide deacetylase family protein [Burkholderiaceae bacterium]